MIDNSNSVNDTFRVVRMMIVSDATTWSMINDRHSDDSRGVIYNRNIFILQSTVSSFATAS
jgi:hypothetical protein